MLNKNLSVKIAIPDNCSSEVNPVQSKFVSFACYSKYRLP